MRASRFIVVCASALLFAGCDDEGEVTLAPVVPLAYTRFVHAVPDTSGTDWRFIDQLEYSPDWFNLTFRQFTPYRATAPGQRHLRVFPKSTDINETSAHLIDTVLTFAEDTYYTIIHVGYSRTGSTPGDHIVLVEDPIPDVPAAQVAIRAMHLGSGLPAVDVFQTASASGSLPGSPAFADLAFGEVSPYQLQTTGAFAFQATQTGQTTPVIASASAPAGVAGVPEEGQTTIGGATMGGSAILGIFMPGSVVGSNAPQTGTFVVQNSTGNLSVSAAPALTGYARASGSFASDGFAVGQTITATGFTDPANNGTSVVTGIVAGGSTGTTSLGATATGYTRTSGSFVADGFVEGQWITAAGFKTSANNGRSRVTAVTPLALTVTKTGGNTVETDSAGKSLTGDQTLTVNKAGGLVVEASGGSRSLIGPPRPAWVYIIDRHPR